jgi:RNA polymerase sigma-70 factor, ECF subfamily
MTVQQATIDNALMTRFQRHLDEDAFEQLVSTYTAPALTVANQFLHDHALAEDAVQEAFVRVVHRRNQFKPSHSFSPWFYAILRHVCIDMLRRVKRHRNLVEQLSQTTHGGNGEETGPEELSLLNAVPARERCVLELRIVHGLSFRAVAQALNISEEAAKKRGQRGLRRLRERCKARQSHQRQAV